MLFQTLNFFFFFSFVFFVFHYVLKKNILKLWFLFCASLFFYGCLDYRFVPLLLFTSLFDFYIAKAIGKESSAYKRKLYLSLSVISNISALIIFKYAQFFTDNSLQIYNYLFGREIPAPIFNIVIPVGISFYTFQSLSYVIDVYRGQLTSQRLPLEFLTAVSFFPHLIAGPIVRASTLLYQFEKKFHSLNSKFFRDGILIFSVGFLKKGIGDVLGNFVNPFFAGSIPITFYNSWLAGLGFTAQLYADFSGYMDMAIGLALLLGIVLPESFNYPFLSKSPAEFWRRWNISLSLWFRDYLYIPLGGNRSHHLRNIFVTMFLSGMWHGASWNCIFWGTYHSVLLVLNVLAGRYLKPLFNFKDPRLLIIVQILITFYLTVIGNFIFRTDKIDMLPSAIKAMHILPNTLFDPVGLKMIALAMLTLVMTHLLDFARRSLQGLPGDKDNLAWFFAGAIFSLAISFNGGAHAFIYFQI